MAGPTAMLRAFMVPYIPMPEPTLSRGIRSETQVDMHTEQQAKPAPWATRASMTTPLLWANT